MVVVGANTRRLLGNLLELQDLGVKEVRGIAEPVHAWAALRASAVESRFEALRTATTPLVGRDEEIALLMRRHASPKPGRRRTSIESCTRSTRCRVLLSKEEVQSRVNGYVMRSRRSNWLSVTNATSRLNMMPGFSSLSR
jgi:hypothetical protein